LDATFARQGFRVEGSAEGDVTTLADRIAHGLAATYANAEEWSLSVWVPDADATRPLEPQARELREQVLGRVQALHPDSAAKLRAAAELPASACPLCQVALLGPSHAVYGSVLTEIALSRADAGRARMRVGADRPSRATRKVEEALHWFGVAPGPGELCVDLGAAPGGWSWALLKRRARVIAVDPALLRPDIATHRGLTHVQDSAFRFAPDEPVDWLFCDMAWRPLEVAALLEKWGRNRWASFLVANLKLPMKRKAEMVERLRSVVGRGWERVKARQLYHDREEITLIASR
jgi:23S rRNA (cytidine2498-2'-O)-methyltransferase